MKMEIIGTFPIRTKIIFIIFFDLFNEIHCRFPDWNNEKGQLLKYFDEDGRIKIPGPCTNSAPIRAGDWSILATNLATILANFTPKNKLDIIILNPQSNDTQIVKPAAASAMYSVLSNKFIPAHEKSAILLSKRGITTTLKTEVGTLSGEGAKLVVDNSVSVVGFMSTLWESSGFRKLKTQSKIWARF
ncbi:uncharacterized protein LOC110850179 isoform X2 [Folsomia candida]|uniref:uncharacterized protein LOC110850179 isoform X2 n=1 Tax=Folsomia candida TaxID=158441 RepID=UPI000B907642|nr:uncharacterized protein LOC110850179 isoform X2 [Folsomia candida]